MLYEGFAPHGVALMFEVVTDNRNRTVAEIRHLLARAGGNMAEAGAVSWQFRRAAYFTMPLAGRDPDAIFEMAVEAGADDVIIGGEDVEIIAPVEAFKAINDRLLREGIRPDEASLRMIPSSTIELPVVQTVQVMKTIEQIEDLDDVQHVYSSLQVTEEAVGILEAA